MHLFRMYWQRTLRRPGSVLIWLSLPFVFMTIYTMVFGNDAGPPKTTMAVVDQDSSLVSRLVKGAFAQGPVGEMINLVDAADTNARFKYLIATGQTGLNVAFDLPTQCGLDSDDPLAEGEVGNVPV